MGIKDADKLVADGEINRQMHFYYTSLVKNLQRNLAEMDVFIMKCQSEWREFY